MVDNPSSPPIAPVGDFAPHDLARLSPEGKASFVASMKAAGFDQAAIDAKLVLAQASSRPSNTATLDPNLTASQVEAAKANLLAHGVKQEEIDRAQNGATIQRRVVAVDPTAVPPTADGYAFDYTGLFPGAEIQELREFDKDLRAGVHAAGLPIAVAPAVIRAALETAKALSGRPAEEVNLYRDKQLGVLRSMVRGDDDAFQQIINKAAAAFKRMTEEIRERLKSSNATKNASFLKALADAEDARASRK